MSGLTADLLDLLEIQRAQSVTIPTIEVPLPRHRNALGSWGDLEQEDPAFRQFQFMDRPERDPPGGVLGDLQLEMVEIGPVGPVSRTDDLARLVLDAKYQPGSRLRLQIGFIGQRREIPAEIIGIKARPCLLELHPFRFGGELKQAIQLCFEVGSGHRSADLDPFFVGKVGFELLTPGDEEGGQHSPAADKRDENFQDRIEQDFVHRMVLRGECETDGAVHE